MTPMMEQYWEIKNQYKDYIVFYRLGDFYEMFFDDAIIASRELELTLTGRDCGEAERAPMCGVPFHSYEGYVGKLIEKTTRLLSASRSRIPRRRRDLSSAISFALSRPERLSKRIFCPKTRTIIYVLTIRAWTAARFVSAIFPPRRSAPPRFLRTRTKKDSVTSLPRSDRAR